MSESLPEAKRSGVVPGSHSGRDRDFAIVVGRFNHQVTERLLQGCLSTLESNQTDPERIVVHWVPGAMEIGVVAMRLAQTGRFAAVICLGAVVRGETPHFDFVSASSVEAVSRVALASGIPTVMGILTTNTVAEALERTGGSHGHKGEEAALTALEMADVMKQINRARPAVGFGRTSGPEGPDVAR